MINIFFIVHNHSGCKTYADELTYFLSLRPDINLYKIILLGNSENKEISINKQPRFIEYIFPRSPEMYNDNVYYKLVVRILYSYFSKLDNIICHINTPYHLQIALHFKLFFAECKVVFTLHYLENFYYYRDYFKQTPKEFEISGDNSLEICLRNADHVICVTEFANRVITEYFSIAKDKISTIYNGIRDTNEFLSEKAKLLFKESLGYNSNDKIILFAGLLEARKGVDKLIEAFGLIHKKLHNVRLVIIGDGNYDEYLQLANQYIGLISFTGKLKRDVLVKIYQIADLGIIPSQYEQCSYIGIEMMQYRLPLIISNSPGLNEIIAHGESGLICKIIPRSTNILTLDVDAEDLADKIRSLIENPIDASRMALKAFQEYQKRFTINKMGEQTTKSYLKLIKK